MDSLDNITSLIQAIEQGERVKFLCFWGHTPRKEGQIGAECLSQWYPAAFEVDGVHYATAEHYMMAEKARLFDDQDALERILIVEQPGEAKKLGRQVRGYDDDAWAARRLEAVVEGNIAKFGQSAELKAYLLGTAPRVLVEASPRDRIWGIGMAANHANAENPAAWRGQNLLGFALMKARAALTG